MRRSVPVVQGWCAHPGGGDTCPPPLSVAPCKPTTPRRYPSPGASKLCPLGVAWTRTDPSRPQCRGTLGPGLQPALSPSARLYVTRDSFCKILGILRFQDTEKTAFQTRPRRAAEAILQSGPRLPWQRGLRSGFLDTFTFAQEYSGRAHQKTPFPLYPRCSTMLAS